MPATRTLEVRLNVPGALDCIVDLEQDFNDAVDERDYDAAIEKAREALGVAKVSLRSMVKHLAKDPNACFLCGQPLSDGRVVVNDSHHLDCAKDAETGAECL
jgi:hypothetical protein